MLELVVAKPDSTGRALAEEPDATLRVVLHLLPLLVKLSLAGVGNHLIDVLAQGLLEVLDGSSQRIDTVVAPGRRARCRGG